MPRSSRSRKLIKVLGKYNPFKDEERRTYVIGKQSNKILFSSYDRDITLLKRYEKYYRGEGTVWAAINSIAFNTTMTGYTIKSDNPEAKKIIERFCMDFDLESFALKSTIFALVYGDSFGEIIYKKNGKPSRVKGIDPKSMQISYDDFGDIDSYYQIIEGTKKPSMGIDKIYHLNFFPRPDSPYGISLIEPSRDTIKRKVRTDEALASAIERHGTPKYVLYVGTDDDYPNEDELDAIETKFEDLSHDNEFILSGNCRLETVDDKGIQGIEDYFGYFQSQAVTGLLCPEEALGLGRGPLHPNTEIFVKEKGFVKITEVKVGDEILTFNNETGIMEFQVNRKNWMYYVDEELYHFKGQTYDLITTNDHRMYYRGQHKDDFSVTTADKLPSRFEMMVGGFNWIGTNQEYEIIPEMEIFVGDKYHKGVTHQVAIRKEKHIPINIWLEFLGYFISEGYTSINKNGYTVGIRQYPGNDFEKMKQCIEKLPFNVNIYDDRITICSKQLTKYLEPLGKSYNKYIPEHIKNLPSDKLEILYNALMVGDGCQNNYFTSSERLANDVQEILIKMGYGSSIYERDRIGNDVVIDGKKTGKCNYIQYTVTKNEKNLTPEVCIKDTKGHKSTLCKEHYKGYVHCVTVDNGLIIARHNGKISVTGNSTDATANTKAVLYERMIKAFQHKLSRTIESQIFNRVLESYGMDSEIVRIEFKSVTDRDEALKARWLSDIMRSFMRTKYRPFTINEIREMMGKDRIDNEDADRIDVFEDEAKYDDDGMIDEDEENNGEREQ